MASLLDNDYIVKKLEAVSNSRSDSNSLLLLFGGSDNMPSSVMFAKREVARADRDLPSAERSYKKTDPYNERLKQNPMIPKSMDRTLRISGRGVGAGALSIFPQKIGRSMVLFYSKAGDTIVDPFAGHASRINLCVEAGRHYIGCDLSTEFMKFNFKRAKKLRKQHPNINIELHHCDSRKMPVGSNVGDYTITSPPYFDIEYYGDEKEQLGKCPTYKDFLAGMQLVMNENFRTLKSGAYACWFINDFRRKGKFYSYHSDIIRLGKRAGFIHHDIIITYFGRGLRDCFLNQAMQQKILPKRHEYGVVFRKPL